jgi:hypothetical protein
MTFARILVAPRLAAEQHAELVITTVLAERSN